MREMWLFVLRCRLFTEVISFSVFPLSLCLSPLSASLSVLLTSTRESEDLPPLQIKTCLYQTNIRAPLLMLSLLTESAPYGAESSDEHGNTSSCTAVIALTEMWNVGQRDEAERPGCCVTLLEGVYGGSAEVITLESKNTNHCQSLHSFKCFVAC